MRSPSCPPLPRSHLQAPLYVALQQFPAPGALDGKLQPRRILDATAAACRSRGERGAAIQPTRWNDSIKCAACCSPAAPYAGAASPTARLPSELTSGVDPCRHPRSRSRLLASREVASAVEHCVHVDGNSSWTSRAEQRDSSSGDLVAGWMTAGAMRRSWPWTAGERGRRTRRPVRQPARIRDDIAPCAGNRGRGGMLAGDSW